MAYAVREERTGNAAGQDSVFGVPRATGRGVRGLEDPETLKSFDQCAMAEELNCIPVQTRFQAFER
jgi:hypothetical protein